MPKDRKLVARTQKYEVAYFAKKYGISRESARQIIAEHGNSRRKLDAIMELKYREAEDNAPA